MGTYCTTTTLETLWGGASFTGITATATKMITMAENEINKKLAQRYDISSATFQTSTSIPPVVTTICEWLSLGFLIENQARGSKDAYQRADRYIKKAMANLQEIVDQKADLLDSDGAEIDDKSTAVQVLSSTSDYRSTFDEDHPLNWSPDPDKLDDIDSDRD